MEVDLWLGVGCCALDAQESPRLLAAGGWTSLVWPGEGLSSLRKRIRVSWACVILLKEGGLVLVLFGRVLWGFCV